MVYRSLANSRMTHRGGTFPTLRFRWTRVPAGGREGNWSPADRGDWDPSAREEKRGLSGWRRKVWVNRAKSLREVAPPECRLKANFKRSWISIWYCGMDWGCCQWRMSQGPSAGGSVIGGGWRR